MDHSLQVDVAGTPGALAANLAIEYQRNAERYRFARWAEQAFANLRVVPPGKGIVHQVNMEFLASVVAVSGGESRAGRPSRHPRRHRLAHHHGQRHGSPRLGCRGHQGRGGDAGRAHRCGRPRGRRGQVGGSPAAPASPAPTWCWPSPGCCGPSAWSAPSSSSAGPEVDSLPLTRPGHHRQHGTRVRCHRRLLRGRRRDAPLPPPHRPEGRPHRPGGAVLPGPGHVPDARIARAVLHQDPRHRPPRHRAGGGRPPPPPPDAGAVRGSRPPSARRWPSTADRVPDPS